MAGLVRKTIHLFFNLIFANLKPGYNDLVKNKSTSFNVFSSLKGEYHGIEHVLALTRASFMK